MPVLLSSMYGKERAQLYLHKSISFDCYERSANPWLNRIFSEISQLAIFPHPVSMSQKFTHSKIPLLGLRHSTFMNLGLLSLKNNKNAVLTIQRFRKRGLSNCIGHDSQAHNQFRLRGYFCVPCRIG